MKVLRCRPIRDGWAVIVFAPHQIISGWANVYDFGYGGISERRTSGGYEERQLLYRIRVIPKVKAEEALR